MSGKKELMNAFSDITMSFLRPSATATTVGVRWARPMNNVGRNEFSHLRRNSQVFSRENSSDHGLINKIGKLYYLPINLSIGIVFIYIHMDIEFLQTVFIFLFEVWIERWKQFKVLPIYDLAQTNMSIDYTFPFNDQSFVCGGQVYSPHTKQNWWREGPWLRTTQAACVCNSIGATTANAFDSIINPISINYFHQPNAEVIEFHIFIHWFHLISWFIAISSVWTRLAHAKIKWSNYMSSCCRRSEKFHFPYLLVECKKADERILGAFNVSKKSVDLFQWDRW